MKLRTYTLTWLRFCAATELQTQSTPRKMVDALPMRVPRRGLDMYTRASSLGHGSYLKSVVYLHMVRTVSSV
jgi:hypothetical protein